MKKHLMLLFFFLFASVMVAQDDEEIADDDMAQEVVCEFTDRVIKWDAYEYTGTDKVMDIRKWNSFASRKFKSWEASKDTTLRNEIEDYYWNISKMDPNGDVKNSKGTAYLYYGYNKLAEIYATENNLEMLEVVLSRGLKTFADNMTLTYYGATFYQVSGKLDCSAEFFEKLAAATDNQKTKLSYLKILISLYIELENKELAMERCDAYLEIDPNNDDITRTKNSLFENPEELLASLEETLKNDAKDLETMKKAFNIAYKLEEFGKVKNWGKILIKNEPKNEALRKKMVRSLYELEELNGVISYGSDISDKKTQTYVVRAYISKGQFKDAFAMADNIGKKNKKSGAYLRGLVYENTASAAKDDYAKKDYEWRLIYRLAYLEYLNGGDSRAKNILPLLPTKGNVFLKNNRVKPEAGKYSGWITWKPIYDKEVYAPDN